LNIKKRKVNIIPRYFYDLKDLRKITNIDFELFVINTSGENKYDKSDFKRLISFLESKFNKATPYEIPKISSSYFNLKFVIKFLSFNIFITLLYFAYKNSISIYNIYTICKNNIFDYFLYPQKKKLVNEEEKKILIKRKIKNIMKY